MNDEPGDEVLLGGKCSGGLLCQYSASTGPVAKVFSTFLIFRDLWCAKNVNIDSKKPYQSQLKLKHYRYLDPEGI